MKVQSIHVNLEDNKEVDYENAGDLNNETTLDEVVKAVEQLHKDWTSLVIIIVNSDE